MNKVIIDPNSFPPAFVMKSITILGLNHYKEFSAEIIENAYNEKVKEITENPDKIENKNSLKELNTAKEMLLIFCKYGHL